MSSVKGFVDHLRTPEAIGPPECPILYRWTFWPMGWRRTDKASEEQKERERRAPIKLMVHKFLPNADDRDAHDHPRPFWTFVLRGGYDDMKLCVHCDGLGYDDFTEHSSPCRPCGASGVVLRERMRAGMIRFRPANHLHRTQVHSSGCWTIVVMGPLQRDWGFWRMRKWYPYKEYEEKFGFGMRCD